MHYAYMMFPSIKQSASEGFKHTVCAFKQIFEADHISLVCSRLAKTLDCDHKLLKQMVQISKSVSASLAIAILYVISYTLRSL